MNKKEWKLFHNIPFQYVCKCERAETFRISLMEGKYHLHDGKRNQVQGYGIIEKEK
jgi:hypothetical protein